ncbi:MAG: 16S rRNA (cytosine(1402)-N(4))-methyltransferase RsmH [Acidobacteria bacterium]|jgi:16S rRNA (cytosine1402-N4)-methyltransferase|nr:16S rRNA (cytosine(1402)-N(4))-methyltransferase RsmH [Acidobacteriota bacterium]
MNREVLEILAGTRKKLFVDCTVGGGGHSRRILAAFPGSRVIAIDQDGESLALARENLREYGARVRFHQGTYLSLFADFDLRRPAVSGVLVDPGISTVQLKDGRRGFSHTQDGPLDMRKDAGSGSTAADVLNTFPEERLADLFARYGEVPYARRLAKAVIEKRLFTPWSSTAQLRLLVEALTHWHPRPGLVHPAAQVFQALRIFVNRELEGLDAWLEKIPGHLPAGSRVVFLTYHSLEDRLVKRGFQELQRRKQVELLRPFPAKPGRDEIAENLASRSAKLRALEVA